MFAYLIYWLVSSCKLLPQCLWQPTFRFIRTWCLRLGFLIVFVTLALDQRLTDVVSVSVLSTARVTQVLKTIPTSHGR